MISDFQILSDGSSLTQEQETAINMVFNPTDDIILEGAAELRPILTWRVASQSVGSTLTVQLPGENYTVGTWRLKAGKARQISKAIPFNRIKPAQQSVMFDASCGTATISDVAILFKRKLETDS